MQQKQSQDPAGCSGAGFEQIPLFVMPQVSQIVTSFRQAQLVTNVINYDHDKLKQDATESEDLTEENKGKR